MAGENEAVVRAWFDGLARGELRPELCDPEIEIRNWAESPTPGPYRGYEGLEQWWADLADAFEDVHFELKDVEEIDDSRVLTVQRIVGRFRLTGVDLDAAWGSIISVRERKIAGAIGYFSPRQARAAAGRGADA
jgi:ketosteroid isomerase-like protein